MLWNLKNINSPLLSEIPNISHCFTTRHGGLNLSDIPFLNCTTYTLKQVHGNKTYNLKSVGLNNENFIELGEYDSIVTSIQGVAVGVKTADCVPILLTDKEGKCVGAIHAGWRSQATGIIKNTISVFRNEYEIDPANIIAVIGPSISVLNYEVDPSFISEFNALIEPAIVKEATFLKRGLHLFPLPAGDLPFPTTDDKFHFDLKLMAKLLLIKEGVRRQNIETLPQCTYGDAENFVSYRREKGTVARQWAVIKIENLT